jgi:hypothetical protein
MGLLVVAGVRYPRLQILTIDDLLASKKIDIPAPFKAQPQEIRSVKQAPKAKEKKSDDARLF